LRRTTYHLPQRQLSKIKGARENAKGEVRRVHDGGAIMRDEVKDPNDLDNDHGPVVLNEYSGKSFGYGGRESDESRFVKSNGLGNKHKTYDVTMNEYFEDSLAKSGRDGGRFAACFRSGMEHNLAIEHGSVVSNEPLRYLSGKVGPMNEYFEDSLAKVGRDGGRFVACERLGSEHNLAIEHGPVVSNHPPRYLSGKVGPINEYFEDSLATVGRDGGRFAACDRSKSGHNLAIDHGPVVLNDRSGYLSGKVAPINEYFEDSLAKGGIDRVRFAACGRSESRDNLSIEHGPVVSNDRFGYLSGKVEVPDHSRYTMTNRLDSECNMDNGFVPSMSTECRSLYQPNLDRSVYSDNAVFKDQHRSYSTSTRPIETQICYPSYSTLYGDALGMSTVPYDPESTSINYRYSSSPGIDHSSNSLKECASPYKPYTGTLIPSPKNQLHFPSVEPKCRKRCPDDSSSFGNHVSFSTPNNHEHFNYRNIMPLSRVAYSENLAAESSENPGYEGLSYLQCALAPLHLSETEKKRMENKGSSFYSGFLVESLGKLECEKVARQEENNEAFTGNVPLSNNGQLQLHGCDYSVEPRSDYHPEHDSLNHDLKYDPDSENMSSGCQKNVNSVFSRLAWASDVHVKENSDDFGHKEYGEDTSLDEHNSLNLDHKSYQGFENVSYGCQKNRNSVFSRLTLASDVYVEENGDDVGRNECDGDTSVDEVMARLRQSLFQSAKTKKSKTLIKEYDEHENLRDTKQTTCCPKLEMDCLVDFKYPNVGRTPCVDFKRRSEVCKIQDNTKSRHYNEIAGSDGSSGGHHKRSKLIRPNFSKKESSNEQGISSGGDHKRRKLIRPNFSKKESSNEQGINNDASKGTEVLSPENSVNRKDKRGSCEVLVGSQDKENMSSQSVELQHVASLISGEYKNINVERGSNGGGESKADSCKTFFRIGYEDEKESSHDAGVQNACEDESNAENGLGIMDSGLGELPDTTPSYNKHI
jgi:hypothetical protein